MALRDALQDATGADETIDGALVQCLAISLQDYTSDAPLCRQLVATLVPGARLHVGYDVTGVLPRAVLHTGGARFAGTAPTVPLAILRMLIDALIAGKSASVSTSPSLEGGKPQ
jgi:hypothetical protein